MNQKITSIISQNDYKFVKLCLNLIYRLKMIHDFNKLIIKTYILKNGIFSKDAKLSYDHILKLY